MAQYGYKDGFFESVSAVTATPSEELGSVRVSNGRVYQYVYNGGGEQISQNQICVVSASTGYTVTVSSVTSPNSYAYGVVREATLTTATYGWVVKQGSVDLYNAGNTAIVAGYQITADADGTVTASSGGTGSTGIKFGIAQQATTTAGTFGAQVNCL